MEKVTKLPVSMQWVDKDLLIKKFDKAIAALEKKRPSMKERYGREYDKIIAERAHKIATFMKKFRIAVKKLLAKKDAEIAGIIFDRGYSAYCDLQSFLPDIPRNIQIQKQKTREEYIEASMKEFERGIKRLTERRSVLLFRFDKKVRLTPSDVTTILSTEEL